MHSDVILILIGMAFHPIHISITEIEMNKEDMELEIMMRVFIDDLELSIRNAGNEPYLDIIHPANKTTDEWVEPYLRDRFRISLDGKRLEWSYLGHEFDGEAVVFFILAGNVPRWNTIEVFNSVIMETHDDQSNLINVTVDNKVRSLRLIVEKPSGKLTFN